MSPAPRLGAALGAAIALALALAGCGGIPTSGPVVAGPAVDEVDPEYVVTPNGPLTGADPRGILTGFLQALRSPLADYQVARQFLTPAFAQRWDPNAGVLIRTGQAELTLSGTESAPTIDYAFSTSASVDSEGRYRATVPGGTSIEFSFAQVDGQWRISSAPDGIVLADASFPRSFASYPLYFFDPTGRFLVPDVRWFPSRQNTPNLVVAALLEGPDEWLRHAVVSEFPEGTSIGARNVVVSGGRAVVDLSAQIASATPVALDRMRQQLVATLDVADATISADGIPLQIPVTGAPATIDPQPGGAVLIGTGDEFGFGSAAGIVPITGISEAVVADAASAVSLGRDQSSASYLAADGSVRHVVAGSDPVTVDGRPGLVAPSLDGFGWTWSAGAGSQLDAFSADGAAAGIVTDSIPADATIAALAVSRDSTRLLVGVAGASGPRILVFGIVRSNGTPTGLDQPLELPASGPIAALAWVDDDSAVVLTSFDGAETARVVALGAPGQTLGALSTGSTAVGGRGGVAGIRALRDGVVLSPAGNGGWNEAGFTATFLGVQQ